MAKEAKLRDCKILDINKFRQKELTPLEKMNNLLDEILKNGS